MENKKAIVWMPVSLMSIFYGLFANGTNYLEYKFKEVTAYIFLYFKINEHLLSNFFL